MGGRTDRLRSTPERKLAVRRAAGKRYYDKKRQDSAWVMRKRERQRNRRTIDAEKRHVFNQLPHRRRGNFASWIRLRYRISFEAFSEMLITQSGRCAICSDALNGSTVNGMHIDHSHVSGLVRGLLCGGCNTGLGGFKDRPGALVNAADYLRRQSQADTIEEQAQPSNKKNAPADPPWAAQPIV